MRDPEPGETIGDDTDEAVVVAVYVVDAVVGDFVGLSVGAQEGGVVVGDSEGDAVVFEFEVVYPEVVWDGPFGGPGVDGSSDWDGWLRIWFFREENVKKGVGGLPFAVVVGFGGT